MPGGRAKRRAFITALVDWSHAYGGAAFAVLLTLVASVVYAGDADGPAARKWQIDTEHLFGFVIGTHVGEVGDKEVEAEVIGGFGKAPGSYAALSPSLEYEFVPINNLRLAPIPALPTWMIGDNWRSTAFRLMSDIGLSTVRAQE